MPEQKLKAVETAGNGSFGAGLLDNAATYEPERVTVTRQNKEPQMRALKRILGDDVESIFPEGLRDSVEQARSWTIAHPDAYIDTEFDDAEERNNVLIVMRAYSELAGDEGYTIATKNTPNPALLRWKVTARRVIGQGDDSGE